MLHAKFIWFDLGYTLVNFKQALPGGPLHPTEWLFREIGESERDREIIHKALFTTPCLNTLEKFSDFMQETFSYVVPERMIELCERLWLQQIEAPEAYPQTKPLLQSLRDAGWLYGFISNATHGMWEGVQRELGEDLLKDAPVVLSCREGKEKPNEKLFDTAHAISWGAQNRNYKNRKNAFVVGDDMTNDILPGLEKGMYPIFLKDQAAERVSMLGGRIMPEGAESVTGYTTCNSIGDITPESDGLAFKS